MLHNNLNNMATTEAPIKTEEQTQSSNYEQSNIESCSSSMDTSEICGAVKVKEDTCDLVISNIKQEPDIYYCDNRDNSARNNEMNVDAANDNDASNINDIVISQIKQEADIFYGAVKNENTDDKMVTQVQNECDTVYEVCMSTAVDTSSICDTKYKVDNSKVKGDKEKKTSDNNRQKPNVVTPSEAAVKPYQCDQCDKTYVYRCLLMRHVRTHSGEKPYQCDNCDKAFAQSPSLKKHMRTHTGEKPYACSQCKKAFSQQWNLK